MRNSSVRRSRYELLGETMQENMIAIVWPELYLLSYHVLQFPSVRMYLLTQVKEGSDDTLSMGKYVITLMSRFPLYFSAGNTMIHFGRNQLFYPIIQKQADRKCRHRCLTSWWLVLYQQYWRLVGSCQWCLVWLKQTEYCRNLSLGWVSWGYYICWWHGFLLELWFLHGMSHVEHSVLSAFLFRYKVMHLDSSIQKCYQMHEDVFFLLFHIWWYAV